MTQRELGAEILYCVTRKKGGGGGEVADNYQNIDRKDHRQKPLDPHTSISTQAQWIRLPNLLTNTNVSGSNEVVPEDMAEWR